MPAKMKSSVKKESNTLPDFSPNKLITHKETSLIAFILSVYNRNVVMIVGDPDVAEKMLISYFHPSKQGMIDILQSDLSQGYGTAFHFETDEGFEVFFIFVNSSHCQEHPTLLSRNVLSVGVHETYHMAHQIMRFVGNKFTDESEESYAYLQEELFSKYLSVAQTVVK